MDQSVYITVNKAYNILQAIPESQSGDNVVISIYNVTDSAADTASTAMTFVVGEAWKYAFTPTDSDDYVATITHTGLNVKYYKYLRAVSNAPAPGAGDRNGSTLTVLQKEFLLSIDRYNANDLTGDGSAGDRATSALNRALQKIYAIIKDSKYMKANPSTSLASTASQDYIELAAITDLDEIANIVDTTNSIKLTKIPFWKYREIAPNPADSTGVPTHYSRLFNRIYLYPRPDSAITYTADYIKIISDLSAGSDQALIPAKFNYWIYAEAQVFWHLMEDPTDINTLSGLKAHASELREDALGDINSEIDLIRVSDSHWDGMEEAELRFDSPIGS